VISIILATYERADPLDLVLNAFAEQRGDPFEVVVADDGSGDEIERVVGRWQRHLEIKHVWQPKEGFRKARALDLAALSARGDYFAFLDADCVPRRGFMEALRRAMLSGWFLATKRVMLREAFSRHVVEKRIPIWRWSAAHWLLRAPRQVGRPGYLAPARDRRRPWRAKQPEFVPPVAAYTLIAVARNDFERVNGYDARCTRSTDGEDQDLAIRLRRSGLRCGWPGPAATLLHLWHPERLDRADRKDRLFRETEASSRVEAVVGLRELAGQVSA
jgi:glycosyltransferase involved in cell wall biosynthesis